MNLSRKYRTKGNNKAKKGRIKKSSYVGYDSYCQSMELKFAIKLILDFPFQ